MSSSTVQDAPGVRLAQAAARLAAACHARGDDAEARAHARAAAHLLAEAAQRDRRR